MLVITLMEYTAQSKNIIQFVSDLTRQNFMVRNATKTIFSDLQIQKTNPTVVQQDYMVCNLYTTGDPKVKSINSMHTAGKELYKGSILDACW